MAESPFWRFSLRFYALPDVAPACLVLQDEAGVDVNLLLFLLFLAQERRALSAEEIGYLDRAISPWRDEVVKPLRGLRRRLKAGIGDVPHDTSEGFRLSIKRAELDAERIEQEILERRVSANPGAETRTSDEAAEKSLAAYGVVLGQQLPAQPVAIIRTAFASSLPT